MREAQVSAVELALEDWVGVKTRAGGESSVECTKLKNLGINIDPNLQGKRDD